MKNISRLRIAVSKKYLDWAEKLPTFRGGGINVLQVTREFDRKEANDHAKRIKPPSGASIEFPYFRLIEIFTIEEFDGLRDGLLRLFPQLSDPLSGRDFASSFGQRADAIKGGSWQHIGYVFRDAKKRFLGLDAYREMKDLPEVVEWIHVTLHRFLPSLIVVALDVNLSDEATNQLNSLQQAAYLPEVQFRSLLPWKAWRGCSINKLVGDSKEKFG